MFNHFQVLYVDYGTVEYVQANSLCFVHQYSAKLPTQAFRACLNNIRPIDIEWDFEACRIFNKATRRQSFNATLMGIDIHVIIL